MKTRFKRIMPFFGHGVVVLSLFLLGLSARAETENLRSSADGRAWSVLLQADEDLRWRWVEGATTATLTASNLVTGVISVSSPVVRGEALDGSCTIPSTGAETARLVDVTLVQADGETLLETCTARIRIGQPSTTVLTDAADKSFRQINEPTPFAWSDVWAGLSAETATLKTAMESGREIGSWALPASGYGVIRPKVELGRQRGKLAVAIGFDDEETPSLLGELWALDLGTLLLFR